MRRMIFLSIIGVVVIAAGYWIIGYPAVVTGHHHLGQELSTASSDGHRHGHGHDTPGTRGRVDNRQRDMVDKLEVRAEKLGILLEELRQTEETARLEVAFKLIEELAEAEKARLGMMRRGMRRMQRQGRSMDDCLMLRGFFEEAEESENNL